MISRINDTRNTNRDLVVYNDKLLTESILEDILL